MKEDRLFKIEIIEIKLVDILKLSFRPTHHFQLRISAHILPRCKE